MRVALLRWPADVRHMGSRTPARKRLVVRLPQLLVIVASLTLGALVPAGGAEATTYAVNDQASFDSAIAKAQAGDTVSLAPGRYPVLLVKERSFASPVRIVGSRDTHLAGFTFNGSHNLVLSGVTITPPGDDIAKIWIANGSSDISIDDVLVDGRDESVGAFVQTDGGTSDVTIQNSSLTNCGTKNRCVDPDAANLRILNNNFYDCRSCIFIKGGGGGATIMGNSFDHAWPGRCQGGQEVCPHNDLIAIFGGGPWTIVGNRFGDISGGTAQIYVNPAGTSVHDVYIASNVFAEDVAVSVRIGVGEDGPGPPPTGVTIVNNTFLFARLTAVEFVDGWAEFARAQQPVVANNIFAIEGARNCSLGQFVGNLATVGSACGGDVGPANLDPNGQPTPASSLVIDRADSRYAPSVDFLGHARVGPSDRGAFEFLGQNPNPPPPPPPLPPPPPAPPAPPLPPAPPAPPGSDGHPDNPPPSQSPQKPSPAPVEPKGSRPLVLVVVVDGKGRLAPGGGATVRARMLVSGSWPPGLIAVTCKAGVAHGSALRVVSRSFEYPLATCTWKMPKRPKNPLVRGAIRLKLGSLILTRAFSQRF
jgi:hypothetical protein